MASSDGLYLDHTAPLSTRQQQRLNKGQVPRALFGAGPDLCGAAQHRGRPVLLMISHLSNRRAAGRISKHTCALFLFRRIRTDRLHRCSSLSSPCQAKSTGDLSPSNFYVTVLALRTTQSFACPPSSMWSFSRSQKVRWRRKAVRVTGLLLGGMEWSNRRRRVHLKGFSLSLP